MKRSLNQREKRLLIGCLLTLFVAINVLAFRSFSSRRSDLKTAISRLKEQSVSDKIWLDQKGLWQKRAKWLDANMTYTDSPGRSQGQLLEELQTTALDAGLKVTNQTLLESPPAGEFYKEVAASVHVRGDQDKLLRWLLSLQSPERFQPMKAFEIELDPKAKEKVPQAQCNLTLAKWFNPNAPLSASDVLPNPLDNQ
jgi:hypothetical protein